jgi:hypothetical protein
MQKILLIMLLFVSLGKISIAQKSTSIKLPEWVAMIDNPTVNYFVALQTFEDYWKDKIRPIDEAEPLEEKAAESEAEKARHQTLRKELANMTPAERNVYDQIQYHYKRFRTWARESKPYVQEDGSILSNEARMEIWNKQQLEIKK